MGRNGTNGVARAGQVDVDGVVPIRVFPLQDRLERLDASIRKQDVEPAKSGARVIGRDTQSREVALVEPRFAPTPSSPDDHAASFREFVARRGYDLKRRTDRPDNVDAHHVGTFASKSDRRRAPDSASGACNDGSLVTQPS